MVNAGTFTGLTARLLHTASVDISSKLKSLKVLVENTENNVTLEVKHRKMLSTAIR